MCRQVAVTERGKLPEVERVLSAKLRPLATALEWEQAGTPRWSAYSPGTSGPGPEPSSASWRALVLPQPLLLSLYGLGVGLGAREDTGSHCSDRPRGPGRLCPADPNVHTCGSVLGTRGHTFPGTHLPAGPMERRHTAQLWLIVSTDFKEN